MTIELRYSRGPKDPRKVTDLTFFGYIIKVILVTFLWLYSLEKLILFVHWLLFYFDNDVSDIETSVFSVVFFSEIYLPLFKESLLPRAPDQIVSIRVSAVGAVTMVDAVTQVDKTFSSKEIQVDMDPEPDKDLYGNWKRICKEHSYFLN